MIRISLTDCDGDTIASATVAAAGQFELDRIADALAAVALPGVILPPMPSASFRGVLVWGDGDLIVSDIEETS